MFKIILATFTVAGIIFLMFNTTKMIYVFTGLVALFILSSIIYNK